MDGTVKNAMVQNTGLEYEGPKRSCGKSAIENAELFSTLHFCRLEEPILQSLWQAAEGFFGYNSPNLNRFG